MDTALQNRSELDEVFREVLGSDHVYFQPPYDIKMKYPAIVYYRDDIDSMHANNQVYKTHHAYTATVVSKDPDEEVIEKMANLPLCTFNRHYTADGLNHEVFRIYYK